MVTQKKKKKIKWYITSEETGLIPQPFRSYIDQMRPMAVVPALIFGFFTPLILGYGLVTAFAFALLLGFMQAGAQTINLSSPYEAQIDIENNKGYRPTPSGRIPPKMGTIVGFSYLFIATLIGITLNFSLLPFLIVYAFLAASFTVKPFYFKRIFPANIIVEGLAKGFFTTYLLGMITHHNFLTLSIFMLIWATALQSTKDFGDVQGDKKYGIQTLPVMIGKQKTQVVMALISISSYIYAFFAHLPLEIFITLPYPLVTIYLVNKRYKVMENNLGWFMAYMGIPLMVIFSLFFIKMLGV